MKTVFLDTASVVPQYQGQPIRDEQLTDQHWDISPQPILQVTSKTTFYSETSSEQVLERCADAEVVITNKVIINKAMMQQLPRLKLICIAATGVNNVDLVAASELGISVSNVAGYSTPSVVQVCFSLLLSLSAKLPQVNRAMSQQGWHKQSLFVLLPETYHELAGKTLAIIGYGTLGQAVAKVASAFGMTVKVAQLDHRPRDKDRMPLAKLLPQADFVSLHCPQTSETEGMVDKEFLKQMPKHSILINTARGGLINEQDLADALRHGTIAGAGIDVLSTEPPAADNPLLANDLNNIIITPHIAWASQESRQRLVDEIAQNMLAFANGKTRNRVN
ncbi:MAG: D-2-hydroxyacid dehydrogenase [Kangiellaceae bacterium]|jgi:glycerate dehydrogenase|nr:D-2-hydroxyacid dehydrogenase [Kangiellaceae bacterium]